MAVAGIDAIHDGEEKRVQRDVPTMAEFDALEQSLRAQRAWQSGNRGSA